MDENGRRKVLAGIIRELEMRNCDGIGRLLFLLLVVATRQDSRHTRQHVVVVRRDDVRSDNADDMFRAIHVKPAILSML